MRLDEELTAIVVEMDRIFHALIDLEMKHALPSIGEVTFGLMCRIWRLAHEICDLSASGKGEVTEIVARCHFESAVTLLWLLEKHDAGLFQRFKDYAGGVDKRHLEYVRKMSEGTPELRAATEDLLAHDIRQAGMNQLLVAEEKGAWIDVSVREMAEGMDSLYMGVFARTSDIVHGSWRALTRYHLVRCLNPLHAYHWIPNTGPSHDAGLSPIICALLLAADSLAAVAKEVGAGLLWEDAKRLAVSARKAILSRFLPKGMNPAITEEG